MGIYEQRDLTNQKSLWILLQPSIHVCKRLEEGISAQANAASADNVQKHSMLLHATILLAAARNWEAYLDDLRKEVDELVRITLY